jgi:hypothetical protein
MYLVIRLQDRISFLYIHASSSGFRTKEALFMSVPRHQVAGQNKLCVCLCLVIREQDNVRYEQN